MKIKNAMQLMIEIRKILLEHNISYEEIAKKTGKTKQSISQIFKVQNPKADTLIEICNAANISISLEYKDGE